MTAATAPEGARRIGNRQGAGLQPAALGALTRFVDDPLPIDNNWIENQIRPIAIGATTGCLPSTTSLPRATHAQGQPDRGNCCRIAGNSTPSDRQPRPPTAVNMGFAARIRNASR